MSNRYAKTGWQKFCYGLLWTIIIIALIVSIAYILNITIPAVHDFFVSAIDWIKNLFTSGKEVVKDTKAVIDIVKN